MKLLGLDRIEAKSSQFRLYPKCLAIIILLHL